MFSLLSVYHISWVVNIMYILYCRILSSFPCSPLADGLLTKIKVLILYELYSISILFAVLYTHYICHAVYMLYILCCVFIVYTMLYTRCIYLIVYALYILCCVCIVYAILRVYCICYTACVLYMLHCICIVYTMSEWSKKATN